MKGWILLLPVILTAAVAVIMLPIPKKYGWVHKWLAFAGVLFNLVLAILTFNKNLIFTAPWSGFDTDFSLKLYQFNSLIFLAVSFFACLTMFYSIKAMKGKQYSKLFFIFLLLNLAFINGALFANNLVVLLFFWEGLLAVMFGMIMTGGRQAYPTAVKTLVLLGVSDLCMMMGAGLAIYLAGTNNLDMIHLPMDSMGSIAFILMMTGAVAKAGSVPFHTWIPDAGENAPLPFMVFLPASIQKLLGIYVLARICLDLFDFRSGSAMSIVMMTLGAVTILLGVMMALVQNNYKKLLSYSSISQVGYMILGIGTAIPLAVIGGLYYMINYAMYDSCLFMAGGSVERQAGTAELNRLGGLGRKMPVTFVCFLIAAVSISGLPPFNGFFSKQLVYNGALKSGMPIFYVVLLLGTLLTAVLFLKLGHAVFFGRNNAEGESVKEAPWMMLVPMILTAAGCILFGVYTNLPLKGLIEPALGSKPAYTAAVLPQNWLLVMITVAVLILAVLYHIYGYRKTKSGLAAADSIRNAPGLAIIYDWAGKRCFDPYDIGMIIINAGAKLAWRIDRGIDWFYSVLVVKTVQAASAGIRKAHTGNQTMYIGWALAGMLIIAVLTAILN